VTALALCAFVGGALVARLDTDAFSLAWIHSVERVRWEEDWRVTSAGLELLEARVRGTGAGMEPPAGAVLRDGAWAYRPAIAPLAELVLVDAGVVPDYDLCVSGRCRPLRAWLPPVPPDEPVRLAACRAAAP
jgi:hypothetical protein